MSQNPFRSIPPNESDSEDLLTDLDPIYSSQQPAFDPDATTPSLSIILISAASGVSFAVIGLYLAYLVFGFEIQVSAAIATLALCFGLGLTGALLSALTGSRAAASNIFFSCSLVIATLIFFGLCVLIGAIAATFVVTLR